MPSFKCLPPTLIIYYYYSYRNNWKQLYIDKTLRLLLWSVMWLLYLDLPRLFRLANLWDNNQKVLWCQVGNRRRFSAILFRPFALIPPWALFNYSLIWFSNLLFMIVPDERIFQEWCRVHLIRYTCIRFHYYWYSNSWKAIIYL